MNKKLLQRLVNRLLSQATKNSYRKGVPFELKGVHVFGSAPTYMKELLEGRNLPTEEQFVDICRYFWLFKVDACKELYIAYFGYPRGADARVERIRDLLHDPERDEKGLLEYVMIKRKKFYMMSDSRLEFFTNSAPPRYNPYATKRTSDFPFRSHAFLDSIDRDLRRLHPDSIEYKNLARFRPEYGPKRRLQKFAKKRKLSQISEDVFSGLNDRDIAGMPEPMALDLSSGLSDTDIVGIPEPVPFGGMYLPGHVDLPLSPERQDRESRKRKANDEDEFLRNSRRRLDRL